MSPVLTKKRPAAAKPTLDFPQRNEKIASDHYSLRLTAPEDALKVELSIDAGPWCECRSAVGFWWYDWSSFTEGRHEVVARALTPDGRWLPAAPRKLLVKRTAQAA